MIYIRADMNSQIGTGHIMRCLAIADAIRNLGDDAVFIVADRRGEDTIRRKGFEVICLDSVWNDLDTEIEILLKVLWERNASIVLVDSYFVTKRYLESLSRKFWICYIDDLYKTFTPCNLLINYSNYYKKFNYKQFFDEDSLLLGCSYVPLREEFRNLPVKKIRRSVKNLLIMSGGTDRLNIIGQILEAIIRRPSRGYKITVICGCFNYHCDELQKKYHACGDIKIEKAVDNLLEYMFEADIAISAGGTTLYELCACGTPTVCYSLADNQLDNVQQFAEDGLMRYAGDVREDPSTILNIVDEVSLLADQYSVREWMSHNLQKLVDGKGAMRIAERLEEIEGYNNESVKVFPK